MSPSPAAVSSGCQLPVSHPTRSSSAVEIRATSLDRARTSGAVRCWGCVFMPAIQSQFFLFTPAARDDPPESDGRRPVLARHKPVSTESSWLLFSGVQCAPATPGAFLQIFPGELIGTFGLELVVKGFGSWSLTKTKLSSGCSASNWSKISGCRCIGEWCECLIWFRCSCSIASNRFVRIVMPFVNRRC